MSLRLKTAFIICVTLLAVTGALFFTYAQGHNTFVLLLASALGAATVLGFVSLGLLHLTVARSLARLSAEVAEFAARGDLSARLPVSGDDELAHLGAQINDMLDALERSQHDQQRARCELWKSEQLLQNVLESVPVGIWAADPEMHVRLWNAAMERITGLRRDQVLGRKLYQRLPGLRSCRLGEALERVAASGEPFAAYDVLVDASVLPGLGRHLNILANPLHDSDGGLSGIVVTIEDISERKRTESVQTATYNIAQAAAELSHLEDLLRYVQRELGTLIDTNNFYVAFPDDERRELHFAYRTDEHTDEAGYGESASRPLSRGLTEYILETGQALLVTGEQIQAMVAEGRVELIGSLPAVWLGVPLKSGDRPIGVIAVQSYGNASAYSADDLALLQFASSQIASVIERKRAEESLAQERDLLEQRTAAIEASVDGIAIIDENGNYTYINNALARLYGYDSARDLIGRNWRTNYQSREVHRFEHEILPVVETTGRWRGEVTGKRRDGTTFPQDVSLAALPGGELVGVVRDMADYKRLESQFRQAQKMEAIGRLAGGVAHDFNNLLTAITGYASFARDSVPADSSARDDIAQVLGAAERAGNLTRQLLAFSRRQAVMPTVVNLNEVILNMGKMLRRLISEDIELVIAPAPEPSAVKVDAGQIEQVLVNLVVNAGDAMPDGGRLTIETACVILDADYARQHLSVEPGEYVLLAVSDTGCGMTDEVKARVFEPFFTTKDPGKGTGLGLATCYAIVRQNGGHIGFYSEVGKGTTFKIYFPRVEGRPESECDEVEEPRQTHGRQTVLLVEDDGTVRTFAARALRESGYTVLEASNGSEALSLAAERSGEPIDLLITDVIMPHMGGEELAKHLRSTHPEVRSLFISGYTPNTVVRTGALSRDAAFLEKPFAVSSLVQRAREIITSAQHHN